MAAAVLLEEAALRLTTTAAAVWAMPAQAAAGVHQRGEELTLPMKLLWEEAC